MAGVPKRRYSGARERATSLARCSEAVAARRLGAAAAEPRGAPRTRVRRPTRSRRTPADSCWAAAIPGRPRGNLTKYDIRVSQEQETWPRAPKWWRNVRLLGRELRMAR